MASALGSHSSFAVVVVLSTLNDGGAAGPCGRGASSTRKAQISSWSTPPIVVCSSSRYALRSGAYMRLKARVLRLVGCAVVTCVHVKVLVSRSEVNIAPVMLLRPTTTQVVVIPSQAMRGIDE